MYVWWHFVLDERQPHVISTIWFWRIVLKYRTCHLHSVSLVFSANLKIGSIRSKKKHTKAIKKRSQFYGSSDDERIPLLLGTNQLAIERAETTSAPALNQIVYIYIAHLIDSLRIWSVIKRYKMCRNEHILIGSLGDNDALTVLNSNHYSNTFIIFELHLNKMIFVFFLK